MCLFYRNSDKKIFAINGSGRTGRNATLEKLLSLGIKSVNDPEYDHHGVWVSVPGTVAGMFTMVKQFGSGKLSMAQILEPVIKIAEEGVPLPYKISAKWDICKSRLANSENADDIYKAGKSPLPGEKLYAKILASALKVIATNGVKEFYTGKIANSIVNDVQKAGGVFTLEDMEDHLSYELTHKPSEAIFVDFLGYRVWEMKPNTTGIVALVALNILKYYDLQSYHPNSSEYIHLVAEAIKYSYRECWNYLCDPEHSPGSVDSLMSEEVAWKIRSKIDLKKASESEHIVSGGDTSYVAVVDQQGNGCSFICSVSSEFGSGIVPSGCGFVLHDRVKCMDLNKNSPNVYGPRKLPLHTIIPSIITDVKTNELLGVFGIVGRWMQPQGHVQVLLNMIVFGMDPQQALDQPRFLIGRQRATCDYIESFSELNLEDGISSHSILELNKMGHRVAQHSSRSALSIFGRGHIIARPRVWNKDAADIQNSWWSGADPRSDGCAMGF